MICKETDVRRAHVLAVILGVTYLIFIGFLNRDRTPIFLNIIFLSPVILVVLTAIIRKKFKSRYLLSLHLSILLLILTFLFASSSTVSVTVVIEEGKTIEHRILKEAGINSLTLHDFVVRLTRDKRAIKSYKSILVLNQKDTVTVGANKPFGWKNLKIYQKAYRKNYYFNLLINGSTNYLSPGDSLRIDDFKIAFKGFDFEKKKFVLTVNDSTYYLKKDKIYEITPFFMMITPGFVRYSSVLSITRSRGKSLLLIFAVIYMVILPIAFGVKR